MPHISYFIFDYESYMGDKYENNKIEWNICQSERLYCSQIAGLVIYKHSRVSAFVLSIYFEIHNFWNIEWLQIDKKVEVLYMSGEDFSTKALMELYIKYIV